MQDVAPWPSPLTEGAAEDQSRVGEDECRAAKSETAHATPNSLDCRDTAFDFELDDFLNTLQ